MTVLAVSALAGGCGGAAHHAAPERHVRTAAAARPARPAAAPVRITAPRAGAVVAGQPRGDRLTAIVQLRGTAAPGREVTVRGSCGVVQCGAIATANAAGRWHVALQLTTPPGRRAVVVRAGSAHVTLAVRRGGGGSGTVTPAASAGLPPGAAGPRTLIVIGDSLAAGMAQDLKADLPGWHVSVDGRIGRPLAEGMGILRATALPPGAAGARAILAFSLFTNDDPTHVDALESAVRESLGRLGPHGCAVWATIARPPYNGVSYDAANARLEALATEPRLLLVDWAREYAAHPEWQAGDGVHATPAGYAARAQLYADAARSCSA